MGVEVEGVDGGRRESRDQVGVASRASTSILGGGVWKAGRVVWRCAYWMRVRNGFVRDLGGGISVVVMLFFAWERKMVIQMFTCKRTGSSYPACALSRRSRLSIPAVWVHDILGYPRKSAESQNYLLSLSY